MTSERVDAQGVTNLAEAMKSAFNGKVTLQVTCHSGLGCDHRSLGGSHVLSLEARQL